jgi:hypothetical protein
VGGGQGGSDLFRTGLDAAIGGAFDQQGHAGKRLGMLGDVVSETCGEVGQWFVHAPCGTESHSCGVEVVGHLMGPGGWTSTPAPVEEDGASSDTGDQGQRDPGQVVEGLLEVMG